MYKVKLGKTKQGSIQYGVYDNDLLVAVYFQDEESGLKFQVHILENLYSLVKNIMEFIENE